MGVVQVNTTQFFSILLAAFLLIGSVVFILLRIILNRMMSVIDRIPSADWFKSVDERLPTKDFIERVVRALEHIPTEDFLSRSLKHFEVSHLHAQTLQKHEFQISGIERDVADLKRLLGERRGASSA